MCGIAYKHNFDGTPVNNDIMQQFDKQRKRGTEGFGLFNGDYMFHAAKEDRILNWLSKPRNDSGLILFHHRYPTTTINVKRAAHPFSTKHYFGDTQYILVHNGGVDNSDDLNDAHTEMGIRYHSILEDQTYNDSEAFLWDFALYMEGKQKTLKAVGPCAFVCLKLVNHKLVNMYFGRNWLRPLNFNRNHLGIEISSEGEGDIVRVDTLHTWNYQNHHLYKRAMEVPEPAYKGYQYDGSYATGSYTPGSYAATGAATGYHGPGTTLPANSGFPALPARTDNPWDSKRELQKAGNWLGQHLRDKFSHLYPELKEAQTQLEYEQSASGIYVPKEEDELEAENIRRLAPSKSEVENNALRYLLACNGHFDQAHTALEMDYEDLAFKGSSDTVTEDKILLERTLEYISNDPEYIDEESVSSLWEMAWEI